MEISKENVFKVNYASTLGGKRDKHRKWTSNVINFIKKNKLITIAIIIFFMCVILNWVLIYNFMKILENM